jgi:hypothetical protein
MSVSSVGDKTKKKKGGGAAGARRKALKDATPDIQPPAGRIKKVLEDDEGPAAENDEEDD